MALRAIIWTAAISAAFAAGQAAAASGRPQKCPYREETPEREAFHFGFSGESWVLDDPDSREPYVEELEGPDAEGNPLPPVEVRTGRDACLIEPPTRPIDPDRFDRIAVRGAHEALLETGLIETYFEE